MRKSSILGLIMMLSGCAMYTLVEPQRTEIGGLYTVEPQIPWSEATSGKTQIWTVDGPALQELRFINGIKDNEAPFGVEGQEEDRNPKFRKGMTFLEIKDLVVDGLAVTGAQKLETKNLKPVAFGDQGGFRFEMDFVTEEGLEKLGFVVGSVIKEKLYLISYSGTRAHYFAKYKEHVEKLIDSIQIEGSKLREE